MKFPSFEFFRPTSLAEALDHFRAHGDETRVIAGGQSLLPMMALRLAQPEMLVDLSRVGDLSTIEATDSALEVGAMVREWDLERSPIVASRIPLLHQALPLIGHAAIRARGTVGGSIAHADPSAELPLVAVALDATISVQSVERGTRSIPAGDFFQGVFTTAVEPDEIVTLVSFPFQDAASESCLVEVARRHGDFAIVAVAISTGMSDGTITSASVAIGGVGPTPVRARSAEAVLVGAGPTERTIEAAAEAAAAEVDPPADLHGTAAYRTHLVRVLVRRGLRSTFKLSQDHA